MTGARKARPGGRSARVREAVLRATLELLDEGDLSVEKLAQRAEVNKTTIYRRWGDLEGILADTLGYLGVQRVPIPDTGDFERDLAELAELMRAAITEHAGGKVISAASSSLVRAFLKERFQLAAIIVHRAVERGELATDIDAVGVIEALGAPFYLRLLVTTDPIDVTFSQRAAAAAAAAARAGVFDERGSLSKG